MSTFEASARRALNRGYARYGDLCVYTPPNGGAPWAEVLGSFAVSDAEETLEGASIDAAVKGYSVRLRSWLLPESQMPALGGLIAVQGGFDGHTYFHVDGPARSFQRGGRQVIVSLSPTPAPDAGPSAGWDFS